LIEQRSARRRPVAPVRFELTGQTRQAIDEYLQNSSPEAREFLFAGRGTIAVSRHVNTPVSSASGLPALASDPLKFGTPLAAPNQGNADLPSNWQPACGATLLGHSKIESTVRYLASKIDDAIEIAEKIEV